MIALTGNHLGLAVLSVGLAASGCGSSVEPGPDAATADGVAWDGAGNGDSSGTNDDQQEDQGRAQPAAKFVIPFIYKGLIQGENLDQSDLYLVDSDGTNPFAPEVDKPVAITSFSINPADCQLIVSSAEDGTPISTAPCSCNFGCVVDPELEWIIVTVEKPKQTGFSMQIGRFNADLQVKMVKGAFFKDIVDVQFAGGYLYFSQTKYCTQANCQFTVFRYDLENIPQPQSLFLLPPADDPDYQDGQHVTDGHFTASDDGSTIAFISPTIRSSRLYVWRGDVLKELDYICPGAIRNGKCTGTGSEYSDVDPLAMTADGKTLVYITKVKNRLEARFYDTDAGLQKSPPLVDTGDKDYNATTCLEIAASDWKFNDVDSAVLLDEGKTLVFLARSNCSPGKKPFTEIFAIPVLGILNGKVNGGTLSNLTHNFRGEGSANTVITQIAVSPDEGSVAYIATPAFGADKATPLSDASAKARDSGEVWAVGMDGTGKRQLTYNNKYSAVWLTAVPPLGPLQP